MGTKINARPKVLIIVPNYWGKGDTITEAWAQVKKVSHTNLRSLKSGPHSIYFGHDTDNVKLALDEFGFNINHHQDYPVYRIEHKK